MDRVNYRGLALSLLAVILVTLAIGTLFRPSEPAPVSLMVPCAEAHQSLGMVETEPCADMLLAFPDTFVLCLDHESEPRYCATVGEFRTAIQELE